MSPGFSSPRTVAWFRTGWRRAVAAAVLVCLALAAGPAAAWKPKTHIYLAEEVLRDGIDDGKVTVQETDYATGKVVGVLGSFEVNPQLLAALRQNPQQFRAGVIGPDAYPDILTGQQLIHPGTNPSLLGSPADGEPASAAGADAWLTHLWRLAYGRQSARQQAADQLGVSGPLIKRNDTPAIRAFVAGYLTHAAGDMFMHTFVNHYAGGDFAIQPDPVNAVKHIVLEGYVGLRTPELNPVPAPASTTAGGVLALPGLRPSLASIDGVESFIYREMTYAAPSSILSERLQRGAGTEASIPAIFSKLRRGLQSDVDQYDRERLSRSGPERVAYATLHGPLAEYKEAWIDDIDAGLRAWPDVSHKIGLALVYDERGGGADVKRAKDIATQYLEDHLASMAGVPDVAVATAALISKITSALLPPPLDGMLAKLKRAPLEWMIEEATGKSLEQWASYLSDPVTTFDPVMNSPGGGYGGRRETRTTLAQFNREVLHIDDPGMQHRERRFKVQEFPPAFNTVQMTKLAFLSEKGMNDLLAALKAKGVTVPPPPGLPGKYESAMLGFLSSLDADNGWQGLGDKPGETVGRAFFLASGDAAGWKRLFMRQIGERADWPKSTAPAADPTAPPDDTGYQPIEGWAVRFDKVEYDAAKGPGRNVTITASFRNDAAEPQAFGEKSMRTLLDRRSGTRSPHVRMEFVHKDDGTLPAWHFPPGALIPPKGRTTVRYVYDIGSSVMQREVHQWTLVEQRRKAGVTLQYSDGKTIQLPVPRLNLDGTVGEQSRPTGPATASDSAALTALKAIEGTYRTNRRTLLTLTVDGATVTGTAVNDYVPKNQREQLKLTLLADGSLKGQWREDEGRSVTWIDLQIRFAADHNSFAGEGKYTFAADNPPVPYKGERVAAGAAGRPGAVVFQEAGYFALRMDAAGRAGGLAAAPIEVMMTARNYLGSRQGLQYNRNAMVLRGSDGVEYKNDGNYYGASGAERLIHTVWLHQDEQAAVTYLFPTPVGVKPAKLLVKEDQKVIAEFDLTGLPAARPASSPAATVATGGAPGAPIPLTRYEVRILSLNRGGDQDWEAVYALRNTTQEPLRLNAAEMIAALHDAAGEPRYANGSLYVAEQPTRQAYKTWLAVAPGAEVKIRLWFPESATLKPVRHRLRDAFGKIGEGPAPAPGR